jgi:hypothetical protein
MISSDRSRGYDEDVTREAAEIAAVNEEALRIPGSVRILFLHFYVISAAA